jgi:hypothetical protein
MRVSGVRPFIVCAIVMCRRSQTQASKPKRRGRLEALGSYGLAASFGIVMLMGFRPKEFLLGIASGLALGTQPVTTRSSALALALDVVVSASTLAVRPCHGESRVASPRNMPRVMMWSAGVITAR